MAVNQMENDEQSGGAAENHQYIYDVATHQVQLLEDASYAVDHKAGMLLGFIAVVIAVALRSGTPDKACILDLLFAYSAFAALFGALAILISCLAPRLRRLDPNPAKLITSCWSRTVEKTRENVASSLRTTWKVNSEAHKRKARLFAWALRFAIVGLAILAFDVLVVRLLVQ